MKVDIGSRLPRSAAKLHLPRSVASTEEGLTAQFLRQIPDARHEQAQAAQTLVGLSLGKKRNLALEAPPNSSEWRGGIP